MLTRLAVKLATAPFSNSTRAFAMSTLSDSTGTLQFIELIDNFTKVLGRHTLKFGVDETGYKNYIKQGGPALSASLGSLSR